MTFYKVFNNQNTQSINNIPLIKMCGFTRLQDIKQAVQLKVDAIGLVFYPQSPRYVNIKLAEQLIKHIPSHIQVVGLFVNESLANIKAICNNLRIDLLQFHGDEDNATCNNYANIVKKPYIKALAIEQNNNNFDSIKFNKYLNNYTKASGFLLDTKSLAYGGSGTSFNWNIIPKENWLERDKPLILSGGINLTNIQKALDLKVYAIDISSGIEIEKGIKSLDKMQQIIKLVR